ncbi:uncharacterized protein BN490_00542 [Firmicutes bacterium CAG:137]|mgnify:FL=1|jgi:hypothetical protein|nr:uncharacterized protein BN490_00542 [Firmicutes bacterium CAG:137]DAE56594.1 MAG TPA: peptidase [Caudoviricetes sp.]
MKKMLHVVSVLGTPYTIYQGDSVDFPDLADCDGYCDTTIKTIIVSDMSESAGKPGAKADLEHYKRKVIRHELLHAVLFESGLSCNSWGENEEIVDWFAIQFPKLEALFQQAGCNELLKEGA